MSGNTGDMLTLLAIAGIGAATGGLALAAAPAVAGAAGGAAAAGAAATSFSTAGALLGGSLALTAYSQIQAGNAAAQANLTQKSQLELQRKVDETNAAVAEEERQRGLRKMLSTQRAIFGASNISGGDLIAAKTIGEVNRATDLARTSANVNNAISLAGIDQAGKSAKANRQSGYVKASGTLLNFAGQRYDRETT